MSQKDKSNQILKSNKLILTGFVLGLVLFLAVSVLYRAWNGRLKDLAKAEAEKIATRIIASIDLVDQRLPSSLMVREIEEDQSKDPWGRPYKRRWIHTQGRTGSYLVVWSFGPNQSNDSDLNWLDGVTSQSGIFSGDDIGVLVAFGKKSAPYKSESR